MPFSPHPPFPPPWGGITSSHGEAQAAVDSVVTCVFGAWQGQQTPPAKPASPLSSSSSLTTSLPHMPRLPHWTNTHSRSSLLTLPLPELTTDTLPNETVLPQTSVRKPKSAAKTSSSVEGPMERPVESVNGQALLLLLQLLLPLPTRPLLSPLRPLSSAPLRSL